VPVLGSKLRLPAPFGGDQYPCGYGDVDDGGFGSVAPADTPYMERAHRHSTITLTLGTCSYVLPTMYRDAADKLDARISASLGSV
jgi:hypothetical protein